MVDTWPPARPPEGPALIAIPLRDLAHFWPLVLPFAEQMAQRFPDDWPAAEILRQAEVGTLQLWLAIDPASRTPLAAAGTRIGDKPSGRRVMAIAWLAGRDRRRWLPLLAELEACARLNRCAAIEIEPQSRAGWQRALPGYRARPTVHLSKEL